MKSRDLSSRHILNLIGLDRIRLHYSTHEISLLLRQLSDSVEMTVHYYFEAELQEILCSQAERGNKRISASHSELSHIEIRLKDETY